MVQKIARTIPSAMDFPSLTILIPCLNEELGIAAVIREYAVAFPHAAILVVDNGSEDGTAAAAKAAGAAVITEKRRGKARAVATALAAIESELVLMIDGDGSYPAEGGRLLIEEYMREPVDMITGIRSAQDSSNLFRPMHQWGMSVFAAVLIWFSDLSPWICFPDCDFSHVAFTNMCQCFRAVSNWKSN